MLPKNQRIPRKMFPLFKTGAGFAKSDIFSLKFVSGSGQGGDNSRFCFSVSKKVAKNAVLRNKLRRIGYDLIKEHLNQIKTNILAIFYFQKVPKNKDEVAKNILAILKSSKLIK